MIGNGFSATIKDRNLGAGNVVSHKEKRIHHFYYGIYWNSDDREQTVLVCKLPKVGHGLRGPCPERGVLPRVAGRRVCPRAELVKQEITVSSHSLSPVITNNSRAIRWHPDKRGSSLICQLTIRPPSRGHRWSCWVMESHLSKEAL